MYQNDIPVEDRLFSDYTVNNNRESFENLFKIVKPWLFKLIFRITGDINVTQDIMQDTWVRILNKKEQYSIEKGYICNYIYTIAKNEGLKWIRNNNTKKRLKINVEQNIQSTINNDTPELIHERKEITELLHIAMLELESSYLDVLLLHYFSEMEVAEIAEILKRPEGTIKTWLSRGRVQLKKILSGLY